MRTFLGVLVLACGLATVASAAPPAYITSWGSLGSGPGQFDNPYGIAVDPTGNVYVTDETNCRVEKFTSDGTFLLMWGSPGTGNGQFDQPTGITVSPDGEVIVVDRRNGRVQRFTQSGAFVGTFGFSEPNVDPPGSFFYPNGVACDGAGNIYVPDLTSRIQKFAPDGTYLAWFMNSLAFTCFGICLDPSGFIYTTDVQAHQVDKFSPSLVQVLAMGSHGGGPGQYNYPEGLAFGPDGQLYVADTGNSRIQVLTPGGVFVTSWGSYGSGIGQFASPTGVAVDPSGDVYVVEWNNHRVQKFGNLATPTTRVTWSSVKSRYR